MRAIEEGIRTVGIGKKGSKPLSAELIQNIAIDLKGDQVSDLQKGAFFAGLLMKGASQAEEMLIRDFSLDVFLKNAPLEIKEVCQQLVNREELDVETAYRLGRFLFSIEKGDGARGFAASLLRVRYETQDEYQGLLQAMEETFEDSFVDKTPEGRPIIQIAEPFDGVTRSYLNTPLLASFLAKKHYRVVGLVGRNSGPKYGNNLYDLAKGLNAPFLTRAEDLQKTQTYYVDQKDLSPAMDRWVEYRQALIKRPFLATLERFVNPFKADILIASAFHAPYGEKMLGICERAHIPASIIIRNGLEGTCNFALLRPTKVLASVQKAGQFERREFTFNPSKKFLKEDKLTQPSLEENVRLIQEYEKKGKTVNEHFNARIQYMCESLNQVLEWVEEIK